MTHLLFGLIRYLQTLGRQLWFRMRIFLCVMFSQMYLSAKEREEEQRAILERQKKYEEALRRKTEMEARAQTEAQSHEEMVDSIFDFLPVMVGGKEGQAPVGYEVRERKALHILYSL